VTTSLQTRTLVRAQPYGTQVTFVQHVTANNAVLEASFDLALVITDRNQLFPPTTLSDTGIPSVGPYLDVMVSSDQIGTLDVLVQVDTGAFAKSLLAAIIPVAAGTPVFITMLRIPARYVYVDYKNTSGVSATTDFGSYLRSN
jgi:hypothetical protein